MTIQFDEEKQNKKIDDLHRKEAEDLASLLSNRYGVGYINLTESSISTKALKLIPEEIARKASVAAFKILSRRIAVGVMSPTRQATQNVLKDLESRGYTVKIYITSQQSLEYAWERYKDISFTTKTSVGTLNIAEGSIEDFIKQAKESGGAKKLIDNIKNSKKSFRISKIVEILIAAGITYNASDIHIEPADSSVPIRFRVDGVLVEINDFDFDTYKLLLSRIKLLSGMKLNIKKKAQDGRFSVKIAGTDYEIRSSVLPGNNGESIVMRILDPASLTVPLKNLGLRPSILSKIIKEVERPNGMILNTGPTGSGKTTALYSFLSRKNTPGIKIITIENPIEYHLHGIVQTQVNKKNGYTFASGLRASLRQDPDVIMVGEIRDEETATTAVQAALTGHLVFSTLHTNNAAGAFPRLIDLGVDPKILISAINVIIAQRLVRRVCKKCAVKKKLTGEKLALFEKVYGEIRDVDAPKFNNEVLEAVGCPECNGTGYKGRIGIFEAILMDKAVEKAVQENSSARDINVAALPQKIPNIAQDGLIKVVKQITTMEEIERVVDLENL